MKALIIEDEKAAVSNLNVLLSNVAPTYEVIGVTDSIKSSIDWFRKNQMPDVVFMDIHLGDGSAFEIFEHVDITCAIIFTTAYDEYAMRAFRVNSIDYLLKPIGEKDMCRALSKLEHFSAGNTKRSENEFMQFLEMMKHKEQYRNHLLVPDKGHKLLPLSISSVFYFYIINGIVKAITKDQNTYTIPFTLDELAESLDPALFFRANRQYLISRDAIEDIDLWFNGRLSVNLKISTAEKILISKARVSEFKMWFVGDIR